MQDEVGGGVSCLLERAQGLAHPLLPHRNEQPVCPVHVGGSKVLSIDGDDALALLAGRFGDELLDPRAERPDPLVQDERELVPSATSPLAQHRPQPGPRVPLRGGVGPACLGSLGSAVEQSIEVHPDERARDQTEERECRIPSTDVGRVEESGSKAALVSQRLQGSARVGDGHEPRAIRDLLPEVCEVGEGLDGRTGLR